MIPTCLVLLTTLAAAIARPSGTSPGPAPALGDSLDPFGTFAGLGTYT